MFLQQAYSVFLLPLFLCLVPVVESPVSPACCASQSNVGLSTTAGASRRRPARDSLTVAEDREPGLQGPNSNCTEPTPRTIHPWGGDTRQSRFRHRGPVQGSDSAHTARCLPANPPLDLDWAGLCIASMTPRTIGSGSSMRHCAISLGGWRALQKNEAISLHGMPSPSQCQAVPARWVPKEEGQDGIFGRGVGDTAGGLHPSTAHSVARDTGPIPGKWFALLDPPPRPPPVLCRALLGAGGTPERAPLDRERRQGPLGTALCRDAVGAEEQFSIIESPKLFVDKPPQQGTGGNRGGSLARQGLGSAPALTPKKRRGGPFRSLRSSIGGQARSEPADQGEGGGGVPRPARCGNHSLRSVAFLGADRPDSLGFPRPSLALFHDGGNSTVLVPWRRDPAEPSPRYPRHHPRLDPTAPCIWEGRNKRGRPPTLQGQALK